MPRLPLVVLLLVAVAAPVAAGEPARGEGTLFLANFNSLTAADAAKGSAAMAPHGATLAEGKWGKGLDVKPGQQLTFPAQGNLLPKQGTLMFWFKPHWSTATRKGSHTLLSWGWDDGKDGYCALSDGWWEPAGAGRTYLVFENQLYAHCSLPLAYTAGEWAHFAVTWRFDKRLMACLYHNGFRVAAATSRRPLKAMPKLRTPITLGGDKGTPLASGRSADGVVDGLHILDRALDERQVRDAFRAQEPNWKAVERRRDAWLYDVLEQPHAPKRDGQGRILESRALLDEWHRWATRKGADEFIDKLVRAGFNVYIPCVWHGRGTTWPSKLAPMADAVEKMLEAEPEGFDPLANLIRVAHAKGVEVHPWFCVCYWDPNWKHLLEFTEEGTPPRAYEAHNPKFREFIVDLMMEVVRNYDVDGINLDYIRTRGLSTSATAKASYRKRFGSDLLEDVKKHQPNGWPNPRVVQWQNEAIADIVRSLAQQARAVRPRIVLSADGHPSPPGHKPGTQGRDGFRWAQEGWVDVIYSMDYGRKLSWQQADAVRQALERPSALVLVAGNYERSPKGGVESREGQLVADLLAFCQRKYPGNGVALYWMGSLDEAQTKALRAGPFKQPAVPHWRRAGADLVPFGDFESGHRATRPPEFWHRGYGASYLSAFPDWALTDETAASGRWSITTATGREFVACGEGARGDLVGSVALRAAKPGTKVQLRLSWWNRLTRADATKEVDVGPTWRTFAMDIEARRDGPIEIAVRSLSPGVRVWADALRIDGIAMADQFVETLRQDDKVTRRRVPAVKAKPPDLVRVQAYAGEAVDRAGSVALAVDVPQGCVELPCVSGGVPFPRGRLFRREHVRVVDGEGREVAAQCEVLSRWHADGSIMMLLVTVPTPAATQRLTIEFGPAVRAAPVADPLVVEAKAGAVVVRTGKAELALPRDVARPAIVGAEGERYEPPAEGLGVRVERSGPLCAVVAVEGELRSPGGGRCGRAVARYTLWRGSAKVGISHCWIHDERGPSRPVQSMSLDLRAPMTGKGSGRAQAAADAPQRHETGLVDGRVAVRDFWQNHPCAIEATASGYRVWLWPPSVRGVLMPQGFARQWDLLLAPDGSLTRPYQTHKLPVLAADPSWVCASGVFEFLLPPDPQTFPIFEKRVGGAATLGRFSRAQKESRNLYGLFNYGDAPGDGGWANLESMAAHELFLHWLRTRSREHLDMARLAAEHYRDVDIHHGAGFCHTHCNNHVASSESWSHSWIQGVRDLYFLLGDLRALDVLHEVGDRLLTKPVGWTSGRDWTRPMDNLVDIFGATGDRRYLDCARRHILEVGTRQVPDHAVCGAERGSWYEDRYAAGCAFTWYGCQAMAKLHQQTADPQVLDVLRRELDLSLDVQTKSLRSFRILPGERITSDAQAAELGRFALGRGSTLFPPLGYLAHVTGERRYLDLGMNVLAHYMLNLRGGSDAAATSYATVFLHYAKRAGLGAAEEAAAFQRARDFSYTRWPQGVANGGFELDHFRHWEVKKVPGQTFYYDALVRVGYHLDDKVRRSGRRSLRLHSDNRGRTMTVRGRFALKPRRRYRASVWVKADETMHPAVSLSLREYDVDRGRGVALRAAGEPQDGWQRYAGDLLTVRRTVATWGLANRSGTGDAWFDDVAIEDIGPVYSLLTSNGAGRDWRQPAYPDLGVDLGGTYLPDRKMSTDTEPEGAPIAFTRGCLTDGKHKYDYRQKPRGAYAYWHGRERGSIAFDLTQPCRVRQVRVHVLIDSTRKAHGTRRIELREGSATGKLVGHVEPAADGWNEFRDLDLAARRLTLVLTKLAGRAYLTLSEVEIWGEPPQPQ